MDTELKNEYRDKLRRFLATPHSAKAHFDTYQQEHEGATFDEYTKKLENLLDDLDEGKLDNESVFCEQIKLLKLPHNQFGC